MKRFSDSLLAGVKLKFQISSKFQETQTYLNEYLLIARNIIQNTFI